MNDLAELAKEVLKALEEEDYKKHFVNDMYIRKIRACDVRRNL